MSSKGASPSSSGVGNNARACLNCVRAKAKCSPGEEYGGKCQRCHRLQRECQLPLARERTQPRKRKNPTITRLAKNQVEKLEEKLDGLVTLLEAVHERGAATGSGAPASISTSNLKSVAEVDNSASGFAQPTQGATSIVSGFSGVALDTSSTQNGVPASEGILQPNMSAIPSNSGDLHLPIHPVKPAIHKCSDLDEDARWDDRLFNGGRPRQRFALPPVGSLEADGLGVPHIPSPPAFKLNIDLGSEDPEILLNIFRQEMSPNFPFISVSDTTSAKQLQEDRPTLFTAIMAITSRVTSQQKVLGKIVMKQVAERMVINEERNMDLLLGVLTYAGWCRYHFYNIPHLTTLIASAMTLIVDLRLNRPEVYDGPDAFVIALREATARPWSKPPPRSLEERRAFLGYCFLTSIVSNFFHRIDSVKWTPYVEECCNILSTSGGHRDDMAAVALIKIQIATEAIAMSPWHRRSDGYEAPKEVPPMLYIDSLREQIKGIQAEFGAALDSNVCALLHFQTLGILLYKIGLSKSSLLTTFTNYQFNRLEYLYACFEGVKGFEETFFAIPTTRYHCFSISMLAIFTQNHGTLQLLSTYEHSDWSLAYVKQTLCFTDILEKMAERFSQAKFVLNLDPHTAEALDLFSHTASKARWMKSYFENKYSKSTRDQASIANAMDFSRDPTEFNTGYDPMEYLDDAWIQTFLGSWEDQIIL